MTKNFGQDTDKNTANEDTWPNNNTVALEENTNINNEKSQSIND